MIIAIDWDLNHNKQQAHYFVLQLSQENDVAPPPPKPQEKTKEQTTTEWLMNDPKIDPNIRDKLGETPLHYAARWGNAGECQILLNAGRNVKDRIKVDVNVSTIVCLVLVLTLRE